MPTIQFHFENAGAIDVMDKKKVSCARPNSLSHRHEASESERQMGANTEAGNPHSGHLKKKLRKQTLRKNLFSGSYFPKLRRQTLRRNLLRELFSKNYELKTCPRLLRESETTIKIKFALFRGGLGRGAGRKIVQNAIFHGKRHDNKILKVKILLSRNFVVMAQAPNYAK